MNIIEKRFDLRSKDTVFLFRSFAHKCAFTCNLQLLAEFDDSTAATVGDDDKSDQPVADKTSPIISKADMGTQTHFYGPHLTHFRSKGNMNIHVIF